MDATTLAVAQEIDFSFWALFARATFVVKIVMILLIAASVWAWSIIIQKYIVYRKAKRESAVFDDVFWSGEPLDELFDNLGPDPEGRQERIFAAAMTEWRRSHDAEGHLIPNAQARIERSMNVAITREADDLQGQLGYLATIGSVTPFVGLFGTVVGIMNSFIEIAEQQNTSLAVVAPGIAEALLATALGLLAAIPAVVFYNQLSTISDKILGGYEAFADEFSTILSRQLDS